MQKSVYYISTTKKKRFVLCIDVSFSAKDGKYVLGYVIFFKVRLSVHDRLKGGAYSSCKEANSRAISSPQTKLGSFI